MRRDLVHVDPNNGERLVVRTGLGLSTEEKIRRMLYRDLVRLTTRDGEFETPEEADDFDLDDGEEWVSPYENEPDNDPVPPIAVESPPEPAAGKSEAA